jgi:hypothetical protein
MAAACRLFPDPLHRGAYPSLSLFEALKLRTRLELHDKHASSGSHATPPLERSGFEP